MDRQELRARRKQLRLTQSRLGRLLGVTKRSVGAWEAGDTPILPAIDLATRYLLEHPELAAGEPPDAPE